MNYLSQISLKFCVKVSLLIIALLPLVSNAQEIKTFASGSYIINMGIHTGTRATDIGKELKPFGLVYDLLKNNSVPVYVVIGQTKVKDGVDFTYNGTAFKGGTFIIDKKYITTAVSTKIASWVAQGVSGVYTTSSLTVTTTMKYTTVPIWTLDAQNGTIATGFFTNAGIPASAYNWLAPSQLGICSDIFVMPHADPTWATHGNLYNWNQQFKGAIWLGCHAGSALENMYNPSNTSQQTNFLSTKATTAGTGITLPVNGSTAYSQNSLILWGNHTTPTIPYNTLNGTIASGTLATASDPVAQFMGITDAAHQNGSERVYLPVLGQGWRPTTKVITYDPTQANVPANSAGPAVIIAYGRGLGESNRGYVMMEAGHNINSGSAGDVGAQRAFFNWSFLSSMDKGAIRLDSIVGIPATGRVNSNSTTNLSAAYSTFGIPISNLTFTWSCVRADNGTSVGSFTASGTSAAANTVFQSPTLTSPLDVIITVKIADNCGRQVFESYPAVITPGPTPPTANADVASIETTCYVVGQSTTVSVLANDSDALGSALTVSGVTGTNGTWTTNGTTVTFTPSANFFGAATATYTICNSSSLCSTASITVSVGTADAQGCFPGSVYGLSVSDTVKTITSFTGVTNSANILGAFDYDVADATTYAVLSKSSTANNVVLDFGTTRTNVQRDSIRIYWASNNEGNTTTMKVEYSTDNTSYTSFGNLTTTSRNIGQENILAFPTSLRYIKLSYVSGETIRIDAVSLEDWGCVSATPSALDDAATTYEDVAAVLDVLSNDNNPGNLPLTLSIVTPPTNGNISINTNNTITYLNTTDYPTGSANTTDSFTYKVCNTQGYCHIAKARISITNDGCSIGQYRPFNTTSNSLTIQGTNSNMIDGYLRLDRTTSNYGTNNPLEIGRTNERRGVFLFNSSNFSAIPVGAVVTDATFSIYRSGGDPDNLSLSAYRLTEAWDETGATWNQRNTTTNWTTAGGSYNSTAETSITSNSTTGYKDFLVTNLVQNWLNGTYANFGLLVKQTASTLINKRHQFQSSESGTAAQTPKLVINYLTIQPCSALPNRAPLSNPDVNLTSKINQSLSISPLTNDVDPDGNTISITAVAVQGSVGAASIVGSTISYTPNASRALPRKDTILYTISDGSLTDQAYVIIDITAADPIIVGETSSANSGAAQAINVALNDSDPQSISLGSPSITLAAAHGSTQIVGTTITYTPNAGYYGKDTIIYQRCQTSASACTTVGLCDTAMIIYTIINQAPSSSDFNLPDNICQSKTFSLNNLISDPENESLTISILTGPNNGVLVTNTDGSYTYTPDPGFPSTPGISNDTITYQVTDQGGLSSNVSTIVLSVSGTAINNAPVAFDDLYDTVNFVNTGYINEEIYIDALQNDSDPDNDNIKIQLTTYPGGPVLLQPQHGNLRLQNGQIIYTPTNGYVGIDQFEYVLYDSAVNAGLSCPTVERKYDIALVSVKVNAPLLLTLNGTVWNDANNSAAGTFTNIASVGETGTNLNAAYFVYLVDNLGIILDYATVNPDGTYQLTGVPSNTSNMALVLTSNAGTVGSTVPAAVISSSNWTNTTPLTRTGISTTTSFVSNLDFGVKSFPIAVNDNNSTNEDTPVSGDLSTNDTPSGDGGNTWSPVSSPSNGIVIINPNGTYTYTPNPNFNGTDTFYYQVCDASGDCDTGMVVIIVNPVNDVPVAVDDTNTTNEDNPVSGNLSTNDTPSGDGGNTWSPVSSPSNGIVIINPNGTYTFTPNPNFNGTDTFYYQVCDASGDCDTGMVVIIVNPVNDVPVAVDDTYTTNEDSPVSSNLASNDTPSGDGGNTWSAVGTPSNGNVIINPNGTFTYTPNANFNGADTFYYKVCDVDGDCDTAMVVITVNPVNDVPVAVDDSNTTNEDSPVSGNLASNDTPSGDGGNTWSAVGTPSNGNVVVNPNGTYTYTPNANFNGADTFYYKVCDVDGDCDTAMVVITVNPVNDVPVAVDDNFTTTLDVAVSGNLSTNDNGSTDGGNNWSLTINPTNGLVSVLTDGTFTYTPSPGFAGNDTFYYRVCDVDGDCDTAMVVITVNDAPIAVDDINSTNEDTPVSGDLSTNDTPSANGGNTWSAVGTPTNGNVLINPNGTYTYTPNADFNGNDTFYYRVCDVDGDCDTAMVVITVNPENDVPLAVDDINTTIENSSVSGDLSPNDIPSGDGGNTWSAVVAPTNGNVVINPNGTYTYTPNTNFNGNDTFYYRVCDVDGDCDTAMVVITVNPVVPVAVNDSNTTLQNTPVNGTVITNDILSGNGGNTWSLITAANNGIILLNTDGTYTYTPNTDFYGLDTFHYRLCDVDGDCDTAIVVILIQPNHPVATDDDNVTNENTPVNGNLSTNDTPSGDGGNTWSLITPPTNGNVILNPDGTYTYTPNLNFNGADTFTYKVCDINGDCDTARVIIQITGTTPVKDLYLTANAANGQLVNLTWRVSCETEVDRYVLERSNDGVRFETATQVNSRAGCTPTTYKIADRLSKPFTSLYYRVKAIEMNGQFTYSNIALVKGNSDDFVMVSPNPFTDKLNIEFFAGLNEKANAQIYSMQGQILKSMSWTTLPGYNKVMMQGLGQLPAGSYILKLQVNGKMIQSSTLIK